MTFQYCSCISWWGGSVGECLACPCDIIHVEDVADDCSTLEPVSLTTPWPHLMENCATCFESASTVVFHWPIKLLIKVLSVPLILYSSKQSRIHPRPLSRRLSCFPSRQFTDLFVWFYSLKWLFFDRLPVLDSFGVTSCMGPCSHLSWLLQCLIGPSMLCIGRLLARSWMGFSPFGETP